MAEWTFEDLLELPDDGHRYEIDGGHLVVTPPPDWVHAGRTSRLRDQLVRQAPPGLLVGDGGIRLDPDFRIPDLCVVPSELERREARYAAPHEVLLVVETAGPGAAGRDRVTKRDLYAGWGLPLYWILETRPSLSLTVLVLEGAAYREHGVFTTGTVRLEPPAAPYPLLLDLDRVADPG